MKFDIPKMVRVVELKEYAQEMAGAQLQVWVNPPARLIERWDELVREAQASGKRPDGAADARAADGEMRKILSELWSQGGEELRWSEAEVAELETHARETDPGLMTWMIAATFREIFEHRLQIKKA